MVCVRAGVDVCTKACPKARASARTYLYLCKHTYMIYIHTYIHMQVSFRRSCWQMLVPPQSLQASCSATQRRAAALAPGCRRLLPCPHRQQPLPRRRHVPHQVHAAVLRPRPLRVAIMIGSRPSRRHHDRSRSRSDRDSVRLE